MVMGVTYAVGVMLTGSAVVAFCSGSGVGGALGGADALGGVVSFTWVATSGVFVELHWVTGVVVTDAVNGANPCETGVGGMKAL